MYAWVGTSTHKHQLGITTLCYPRKKFVVYADAHADINSGSELCFRA